MVVDLDPAKERKFLSKQLDEFPFSSYIIYGGWAFQVEGIVLIQVQAFKGNKSLCFMLI